jgi:cytochrome c
MVLSVMSTLLKFSFLLLFSVSLSAEPLSPNLGEPLLDEANEAKWNLTIFPDGRNLPKGEGTAAQGELIFNSHCASCHGFGAIGASAMPLVGEVGSLDSDYPEKTVNSYWPYATTLFDYIRRSMPPSAPFSLAPNEIYALCAYILNQDGILDSNTLLNEVSLPQVTMPNKDGFSTVYPN